MIRSKYPIKQLLPFLLLVSIFSCQNQGQAPENLYAKYYHREAVYLPKLIERVERKISTDSIQVDNPENYNLQMLQYYRDSSFDHLVNSNLSLSQKSKYYDVGIFYQALAMVELQQFSKAENILARYCATQQFELNAEACWYYGLVLLKDKSKWSGAVLVFRRLSQSVVSPRAKDAKIILDILDKSLKKK